MKLVKLKGLAAGEEIWVNPEQVGAVFEPPVAVRGSLPLGVRTIMFVGGTQLQFGGKIDEVLAILEGKPLVDLRS